MKVATPKQILFFKSLFPKYRNKLKQENRYYSNNEYERDYILTVKHNIDAIEKYPEQANQITMKHISLAIEMMKKEINK